MIKNVWHILLFGLLMFSCTELYNPDLDTGQVPIVVQGLITDSVGLSYVKLYSSTPYDVSGMYGSISNASVFVKDTTTDIGYNFYESEPGMYIPEDINFMGHPGNTYTLHVSTNDGYEYISTPQTILPKFLPKSFYKETVIKTDIDDFDVGLVHTTSTEFYSLKLNFDGEDNTIPRFRFTTKQCIKYMFVIPKQPEGFVVFYCWNVENGKTLNFNYEEYPTSINEVKDFPVIEFPRTYSLSVRVMDPYTLTFYRGDNNMTEVKIYERILRINQFRMNRDAFQYYKGINDMLANEGKIFDPVNVQLYSNMKCTNGDNVVLGFFETSAIATYTFIVDGNTFDTRLCPNLFPASGSAGFTVNQEPDFWNLIY